MFKKLITLTYNNKTLTLTLFGAIKIINIKIGKVQKV